MDPLEQPDRGASGAGSARSFSGILGFCLGVCAGYYLLIAGMVQGDFQGDSWEYLGIAGTMKAGLFEISQYRYLRGLFYPWFLSVTWGKDGVLTYCLQGALFLAALYVALRVIGLGRIYGVLVICAAMIPTVAFLQSIIYPDGVLLSLTLLFFAALVRRRWMACVALGVLLALTKVVFGLVLGIALLVYLLEKPGVRRRIPRWGAVGALVVAPVALWFAATYVVIDLGYMTVFARPYWHKVPIEELFPGPELRLTCSGVARTIPAKELNLHPITAPESTAPTGPLTEDQVKQFGCTRSDIQAIERRLVTEEWMREPGLQLKLAATAFAEALTGGNDFGHVAYMLDLRLESWLGHFDQRSYFEPNEIRLLPEYRKIGFGVVQNPPLIFRLHEWDHYAEWLLRLVAFGTIAGCVALAWRRNMLRELLEDPGVRGIGAFLVIYSMVVAVSAPLHVYDRYTIVNLLLGCVLAARMAALTLHRPAAVAVEPVVEASPLPEVPEVSRSKAKRRRR